MLLAKFLPKEGAQRNVFPALDVARAPIVEEHHAEDVVLGLVHTDALAQGFAVEGDEAGLQLEVQLPAGAEDGRGLGVGAHLAHGPVHRLCRWAQWSWRPW
jgi:hypothetical protein